MAIRLLAFGLGLVCFAVLANAEDDTFTQIGTWTCAVPTMGAGGKFTCPTTNFPTPFGGAPSIVVIATPNDIGNLTSQGFASTPSCTALLLPGAPPYIPPTCPGYTVSGNWIAIGPRVIHATATPKYLVLTIVYAPPGMHGPKGTGAIAYQEGSTVGTTTSASNSFKTAYAVSVNTDGGYFGDGGGNELQFGYAQTITDNHSLDIKVSKTASVRGQGSDKEDGVNNDNDVIYLALSPTVDAYFAPPSIKWTFLKNQQYVVTHVYVAWLKDPNLFQTEAPAIKALLKDNGVVESDYPEILKRDPLANGVTVPPADRYEPEQSFDFVPPTLVMAHHSQPQLFFNMNQRQALRTLSKMNIKSRYRIGIRLA